MNDRLDEFLVKNGFCKDIKEANSFIMQNLVKVNDEIINKSGYRVDKNSEIYIKDKKLNYVSRGAYKLKKAIELFDIKLEDKIALDIGSSTGGFTDLMLKNGIDKVYALDVGYGQLDWKLRNNPKVVVMERFNVRNLKKTDIDDDITFITTDVSFISLKLVIPIIKDVLKEGYEGVALIKPQFEAEYSQVEKGGIVRDRSVHIDVLEDIVDNFNINGLNPMNITHSPITGADGNIEFLIHYNNNEYMLNKNEFDYNKIVDSAYTNLEGK